MEGTPHNLLEPVAQLIASRILSKYPLISAVRVQVVKPHMAVQGPVDYLGVEIVRQCLSSVFGYGQLPMSLNRYRLIILDNESSATCIYNILIGQRLL
ncbi:dihydroneopterin aldolase 1-like [Olea europaea subsp. europaea]|uniref:dihydroneopterin aldolase n=1 Tax=Olea europaea subsp. europaea TaxID=158383 RepID=A0A8S0UDY8_OLEEU|nr:dihydroneopterin aldolase 1-like [Olea europaea subsp. europaea]